MWELVKSQASRGLKLGAFVVRRTMSITYPGYEGQNYNWYLDRTQKIAKLQIEKNGLKVARKMITFPKPIVEGLGEDQYILYLDENAAFISSYKKGKEHLEKFLRKEGIMK